MKLKKIIKNIVIVILWIPIFFAFPFTIAAEEGAATEENVDGSKTREQWAADELLVSFEESYSFPTKLIIIPIKMKSNKSTSQKDMQDLYYYFTTRSGYGDLPFHYLVGWDGDVFMGNSLGDEAGITIGEQSDSIFIGYIQNGEEKLNITSIEALKKIVLEEINKYAINPDAVEIYSLSYTLDEKGKMQDISLASASEEWTEDCQTIKDALKITYSPQDITFSAEIVVVTPPEESQKIGETGVVTLTIRNTGKYNFYGGVTSNLFAVHNDPPDSRSAFYLSDKWSSLSRVALIPEGDRLVVDEEKEFTFDVAIPLFPPEYSEKFVLIGPNNNSISGTEFEVTIPIAQPDQKIIEISDTPVGYLNVRQTPGLGEIITKVSPGERFIILDYQNGYYKIEVDGKEGWVVNTYVKLVS